MKVDFTKVNKTPVFVVNDTDSKWARVYGATAQPALQRWLFPAFPPFMDKVLFDLPKIDTVEFSNAAQSHIDNQLLLEDQLTELHAQVLPVKSYDHQLRGTAELLHNYRWVLKWDTGTGKTKAAVDAITLLRCKTLILCPLIAIDVWVDKCAEYSGNTLNVVALKGEKSRKLRTMRSSTDADVFVVTFDFAARHAVPHLFPKTLKAFKDSGRIPHREVVKVLKRLNDDAEQVRFVTEWAAGRKAKEVVAEVEALIANTPQWLVDLPYDTIVADESHRIKNPSSQRTKACMRLSSKAYRRYLLTATLSQGNPWDIYSQGKFLAPYFIPEDYRQFDQTYIVKSKGKIPIVVGYKGLHVLNERVAGVSSEQRLEDCVDMPERSFETIFFSLSPAQKKAYNEAVETLELTQDTGEPLNLTNSAIRISKLLQLCSGFMYLPQDTTICDTCIRMPVCAAVGIQPGNPTCTYPNLKKEITHYTPNPKLTALEDKLIDLLPSGKTIIWAVFNEELNLIEDLLERNNWGYVRVDGTTTHNIKALADKFNDDPECKIYLGQIHTGVSVTLNAAQYMVYYSRNWSLDDRIQSLGRNYRLGQHKKTVVYDLCAEHTVEVQQLQALQSKDDIAQLLTRRVQCTLCEKYPECRRNEIMPWSPKCVLETKAKKVITKTTSI